MSKFDRLSADDPTDRGINLCIAQIELSCMNIGSCLVSFPDSGLGPVACVDHLLRSHPRRVHLSLTLSN